MFSSITIASSTTSPIARTRASRVSVLMLKSQAYISANAPTRLIGIVTSGIGVARSERRKRKITSTTSRIASADGLEHRLDRVLDEDGAVVRHVGAHALGQLLLDDRQLLLDRLADVERVGGGLLDDAERDRAAAVEADIDAVVERPELGARDVAQADR